MRSLLLGFCVGAAASTLAPAMPHLPWWSFLVVLLPALLVPRARFIGGLLGGCLWCLYHAGVELELRLPRCVVSRPHTLVVNLLEVVPNDQGARVVVEVAEGDGGPCPVPAARRLRLSWYDPPLLDVGERWRVVVSVRQPWGFQNPGGFDYERWMLGKRLHGSGYVRKSLGPQQVEAGSRVLEARMRVRAHLRENVANLQLQHPGIILALLSGDAALMSAADWQLMRNTGTLHLMVVSGLHVGIIAGIGFGVFGTLVRLLPPLLRLAPSRHWGALGAMLLAGSYVALVGGTVPALRALVMSVVASVAIAASRRVDVAALYVTAAVAVLLWEPLAVHHRGFWLSFAAVAILLVIFAPRVGRRRGFVASLVGAQFALGVGLVPVLATTTTVVPLAAPLVNLLLVPMTSLLVVPLNVIALTLLSVSADAAAWVLRGNDAIVGVGHAILVVAEQWPAWPVPGLGVYATGLTLAAGAALAGAASNRQVLLLAPLLVAGLWPASSEVPDGDFRVIHLDVGHGAAVVVDTHQHRLLFDTGARYPGGFDIGEMVVVPAMSATGPYRLDALVLSHADLDHMGGAAAVQAALAPRLVWHGAGFAGRSEGSNSSDSSNSPGSADSAGFADATPAQRCVAGRRWHWDGVDFSFLHPPQDWPGTQKNDGSCVLLIDNGEHRVLLPGDVGARAEVSIARRAPPVTLLSAPHHGSRTSSSYLFVRKLRPGHVVAQAGRDSRFGHPHEEVLQRYMAAGAKLHVTGDVGSVVWRSWQPDSVDRWRLLHPPYWRGR